jgi:general stress protein YciG
MWFTLNISNKKTEAAVSTGERKERRGFASMSPEKQREIASKGGRAAHEKGTAHEWTADEARNAGRKGGQVSRGGRGRLIVPADATTAVSMSEGSANRAE